MSSLAFTRSGKAMYQKLWAVARQVDDVVGDDKDDEAFEMDEAMLYAAV